MRAFRNEGGIALITVIFAVATMLVLGTASFGIVLAQTDQTKKDRTGEAAFNLAEATLNAQTFLLARDWPRNVNAATCGSTTVTGTLTTPAATVTTRDQIQGILAQTYSGDPNNATSQWWVTACSEGNPARDSWDASLLTGPSWDSTAASTGPRRMWVRAEARVNGRRRAVVALVQAGQVRVFPPSLAVVTGRFGADLGVTLNALTNGGLLGPLTSLLLHDNPMFIGNVAIRCGLLDAANLLGCVTGLLKATTALSLGGLLQSNNFMDFYSDTIIPASKVAQLRQQAQASGTYRGTIAAGACLPAGSAGKVVFIEQVGDGTGMCTLSTTGGASAAALVVRSGGIRVLGGGTFTGVLYAMHNKAASYLGAEAADVRIEENSKVLGAVFVDDNPTLAAASRHGWVQVVPPPFSLNTLLSGLGICGVIIVGPILCATLNGLLGGGVDALLGGLSATGLTQLIASLTTQLDPSLPAVTYDGNTVAIPMTMNDAEIVTGTFRQVGPLY
jgi:Tfp pilus assembly protein PilX